VWSKAGKQIDFLSRDIDDWKITFVETGANATIGERLKAVEPHLRGEEMFLANYGDGLSDLPLPEMLQTFRKSPAIASLLLVQPTSSFDIVNVGPGDLVSNISALNRTDIWINGGFFALRQEIFQYIRPGDELVREPFGRLIAENSLLAYRYRGFWQCMDTFKDKQRLEELNQDSAPWKVWQKAQASNLDDAEALTARA
jgi:glucose-1-phosphate cytidylyltransferase